MIQIFGEREAFSVVVKKRFAGLLKGNRNQKCSPDFQICSLAGIVG